MLIGKAMRLIWPEREPVVNEGAAICGVKYAQCSGLQDKLGEMTQVSVREFCWELFEGGMPLELHGDTRREGDVILVLVCGWGVVIAPAGGNSP